jgi:RNA polymerase sigma factor (sigma-70 family)
VTDPDRQVAQFEAHRTHLRAVAYRMLGTVHEADDAVQEAWLRFSRLDDQAARAIESLGGWLTTVVSRICLDLLRARATRREEPLEARASTSVAEGAVVTADAAGHPEHEAELADSVGRALLVVLETLSPAERLAFVLHDLFALPFDEIATTMGRSSVAVRQLASRARRRVQAPESAPEADRATQRQVVEAFLAASRGGDFQALVDLLDPGAVIRADAGAVRMGSAPVISGAAAVAETFSGRAQGARLALLDGYAGAVWARGGVPKVVFGFTLEEGRIVEIELLADPAGLGLLDVAPVEP